MALGCNAGMIYNINMYTFGLDYLNLDLYDNTLK